MAAPQSVMNVVLKKSEEMPDNSEQVSGYDFNSGSVDYHKLLRSYASAGFQATNFGRAIDEIEKMIKKRNEPLSNDNAERAEFNPIKRTRNNCTIFLGYTSNMISSGIRSSIRFLVQHNLVDCIVTTAGGIEEDFIKCLAPTYLGDFQLKGKDLRTKGINRIGNLLVPNNNYCLFEDWIIPILDEMLKEQNEQGVKWTPSRVIHRLGKEIDHPDSVYYWCYKNNIPVFSPGLTDGSIGDMLYMHSYKNPGLIVDIVEDIRLINSQAVYAAHSGMIILGGGLMKHHICNANLMRDGADFALYVSTAQEFDGSDSGARPDEAVSWGKIRVEADPVKVYADATLVFPLLVAETFARHHNEKKATEENEQIIK